MKSRLLLCALTIGCWPSHSFRDEAAAETSVTDSAIEDGTASDVTLTEGGDDAASDSSSDAIAEVLPPPTVCPILAEIGACDVIRAFPGEFEVDGAGDDFCTPGDAGVEALRPRRFSLIDADRTVPATVPTGLTEKVELRAGLSSYGMHVFVHVDDPSVVTDLGDYTQGDAIEIFVRGYKTPLNGDLETDLGFALVIIPPTPTTSARAAKWVHGKKGPSLDSSLWASRRVKGGWEAELHYPWGELMNEASPGQPIGFDLALDVKDDPLAKTRAIRAIMHEETVSGSPPCTTFGFSGPDPLCDDRLWCLAKAYVP